MKHLLTLIALLITLSASAQRPLDSIRIYKCEPFVLIDVFSDGHKHVIVGGIAERSIEPTLVKLTLKSGQKVRIEYQNGIVACIKHTTENWEREFCRTENLVQ